MILGRVIGQVWATRKSPRLDKDKLLLIRPLTSFRLDPPADHLVAVDPVGANVGQDVVVCLGTPCRQVLGDTRNPVDAAVAAIVDRVDIDSEACLQPRFCFREGCLPDKMRVSEEASDKGAP